MVRHLGSSDFMGKILMPLFTCRMPWGISTLCVAVSSFKKTECVRECGELMYPLGMEDKAQCLMGS